MIEERRQAEGVLPFVWPVFVVFPERYLCEDAAIPVWSGRWDDCSSSNGVPSTGLLQQDVWTIFVFRLHLGVVVQPALSCFWKSLL